MYMKRIFSGSSCQYIIRESYWNGSFWTHRDLAHLGSDPSAFIHYTGGNGFYFDEELEEKIERKGVVFTSEDMEKLFFPFLDPHIRRIIQHFQHGLGEKSCSREKTLGEKREIHNFDKRRLHFLRCGRIDIGNLNHRDWSFLKILLNKSRDEKETIIEEMERQLKPREIKSYIYTAFHLQEYFRDSLIRNHPYALNQEKVDEAFIDAVCNLSRDFSFFEGVPDYDANRVHHYLNRYVVLYFDASFDPGFSWDDFIRSYFGSRERDAYRRWMFRAKNMTTSEACKKLRIDPETFKDLSIKDIARMYKQEAKRLHPDRGGDHEAFIKLNEAYRVLVDIKIQKRM